MRACWSASLLSQETYTGCWACSSCLGGSEFQWFEWDQAHDVTPQASLTGLTFLKHCVHFAAPNIRVFSALVNLRTLDVLMRQTVGENLPIEEREFPPVDVPDGCHTHPDDLCSYSTLQHLTFLKGTGDMLTSVFPLQSLTQLKQLNLEDVDVADFSPLAHLPQLAGLRLEWLDASLPSRQGLSLVTQLNSLDVLGMGLSDLCPIACLTQLTRLRLELTGAARVWLSAIYLKGDCLLSTVSIYD